MDFAELRKLTNAYMPARLLQVAVKLNLFDVLASESRTSKGIADVLKTEKRATELFCNALAGMELLEKREGIYSNTELSQKYLVSSAPLYWGWIVKHNYPIWDSWGKLDEVLKSGTPAVNEADRRYTEEDHENFIMGMHSIVTARGDADFMAERLNLSGCKKVLDLGGGPGTFSIGFCSKYPDIHATIFDFSETEKMFRKNISRYPDVKEGLDFVAGNILTDPLPTGYDLVFISNIIHSMSEEQNALMMKKAFDSLNPGGQIVIKDHVMSEDLTKPVEGAVFAIHMLIHTPGRDYSFKEISAWLTDAGFSNITSLNLPKDIPFGIVVGQRVN
jgi:predicted O-methyltransferase YrrM